MTPEPVLKCPKDRDRKQVTSEGRTHRGWQEPSLVESFPNANGAKPVVCKS